jgi:hypothetical protein
VVLIREVPPPPPIGGEGVWRYVKCMHHYFKGGGGYRGYRLLLMPGLKKGWAKALAPVLLRAGPVNRFLSGPRSQPLLMPGLGHACAQPWQGCSPGLNCLLGCLLKPTEKFKTIFVIRITAWWLLKYLLLL